MTDKHTTPCEVSAALGALAVRTNAAAEAAPAELRDAWRALTDAIVAAQWLAEPLRPPVDYTPLDRPALSRAEGE